MVNYIMGVDNCNFINSILVFTNYLVKTCSEQIPASTLLLSRHFLSPLVSLVKYGNSKHQLLSVISPGNNFFSGKSEIYSV